MSRGLTEIAQELLNPKKKVEKKKKGKEEKKKVNQDDKVQLIYAFNGTGKTRLSRAFRELILPGNVEETTSGSPHPVILYYNAFTEDLFSWDNSSFQEDGPRLKIHPNWFTEWILKDQGRDQNIISNFQRYTNKALTPHFNEDFSEVRFSYERGDENTSSPIKISRGEESNFIWSVFFSLFEEVINTLNIADPDERDNDRFNRLKYIFIDDPVSSLDENHLIQLAIDLGELILSNNSELKFIITTHNPLFYNVLYSTITNKKIKKGYILRSQEDGGFSLEGKEGEANTAFSYHLYIKNLLQEAIDKGQVQRYHFMLLRNLYEKTASFLGYEKWSDIVPDSTENQPEIQDEEIRKSYIRHIVNFFSHNKLSYEEVAELTPQHKKMISYLLKKLDDTYHFAPKREKNG